MRKKRGAKRRSKLESDWRKYYGSSEILKALIKKFNVSKVKVPYSFPSYVFNEIKKFKIKIEVSSSPNKNILKALIKDLGEDNFHREILSLHKTKGEMNYTEVKEQFQRNVLESIQYINDNINGKYFKSRVEKWNE